MKIISNFKDYYDYVPFASGIFTDDYRDNVYKRVQSGFSVEGSDDIEVCGYRRWYGARKSPSFYHRNFSVSLSTGDIIKSKWWTAKKSELSLDEAPERIESSSIFVCGKVFPFIYIEGRSNLPLSTHLLRETILSKYYKTTTKKWSAVDRKYIDDEEIRYRKTYWSSEEFLEDVSIHRASSWRVKDDKIEYEKGAKGFFEGVEQKDYTQLHIDADAPLLLGSPYRHSRGGGSFGRNPCLYAYGFERMMSAEKLVQELDMFISNFLVKDIMPPSYQSDLDKVTSHGFDPKTSFRKPKG